MINLKSFYIEFIIKLKEIFKAVKSRFLQNKMYSFIVVAIFILIMFFIGINMGNTNTKKYNFINKVEKALNNSNERQILKLLKVNNKNINLKEKDIEPLIKFYEEDKNRVKDLIDSLRNDKEKYSIKLMKSDGLLGDKYYLDLTLINLTIVSNFKGSNVYINDENKGIINESGEAIIYGVVPGINDIKVENKSKYSNLEADKTVVSIENKTIDMPLDGVMVTLESNFDSGDVYINKVNSGLKVKEFKNIGPFPKDGSVSLTVKANTPWGEIASNDVYIENHPIILVNIDLINDKCEEELNNSISEFYTSVFTALNSEDKNNIVNASDDVKNNIYEILRKKYFILRNVYEIDNLDIKMGNSEVSFKNNEYTGNIVVNISYSTRKKVFGISIKKDNYTDDFFTRVKYINGKWQIYNIDNFSLSGLNN